MREIRPETKARTTGRPTHQLGIPSSHSVSAESQSYSWAVRRVRHASYAMFRPARPPSLDSFATPRHATNPQLSPPSSCELGIPRFLPIFGEDPGATQAIPLRHASLSADLAAEALAGGERLLGISRVKPRYVDYDNDFPATTVERPIEDWTWRRSSRKPACKLGYYRRLR